MRRDADGTLWLSPREWLLRTMEAHPEMLREAATPAQDGQETARVTIARENETPTLWED